jgi:hypothetical protein
MQYFRKCVLLLAASVLVLACQPRPKTAPGATETATAAPVPAQEKLPDVLAPSAVPSQKNAADAPLAKLSTPPSVPAATPAPAQDETCQPPDAETAARMYPWPRRHPSYEAACSRISPPPGAKRVSVSAGSYAHWLRHLPLLPPNTPVRRYDGSEISWATQMTAAVVDLDVGTEDLQQCMDSIIRLRAEYHWSRGRPDAIRFPYAGGLHFSFDEWRRGLRPRKNAAGKQELAPSAAPSDGRKSLLKYLRFMFAMTGTAHYPSAPRVAFEKLEAGDFFLEPSPSPQQLGHALVILDIARDTSGRTWALVGQGFTPAQDFHILRASSSSAWFELTPQKPVQFPSWGNPFGWAQLHRMRD